VPSFVRRLLGIRSPSSTITASIMIRSYYVLLTLMICGLWRFIRRTIDTVRKVTCRAYPLPTSPLAQRPSPAPQISAADRHAAPGRRPHASARSSGELIAANHQIQLSLR
jgi:hypothetical protein